MISLVQAYDRIDDVKKLFSEYTEMLVSIDPSFHLYLEIQHYDREMENPAIKYALPADRLYIALSDGNVAGCVALRKLDDERCELKRLYVRPEYRGQHIAAKLMDRIIGDARSAGYSSMYLDTLPELAAAVRLYEKYGFEYTECYNDSPSEKTLFMKKDL